MDNHNETDFVIKIDFDRNAPDPGRVFRAAEKMIAAIEMMDRELVSVVDANIRATLVLDDIERGSIRIRLRNLLAATDDQGIKELDWKPMVGKYLVQAKYEWLAYLDETKSLREVVPFRQLASSISSLASKLDIQFLLTPKQPSLPALIDGTAAMANANAQLARTDVVTVETFAGTRRIGSPQGLDAEKLKRALLDEPCQWPPSMMVLKVKRPDLLGTAKWEFRHGRSPILAKIEDDDWLERFKRRAVDALIGPGDSLRCDVTRQVTYDQHGEVVEDVYTVVKVHGVIQGIVDQLDLLQDA